MVGGRLSGARGWGAARTMVAHRARADTALAFGHIRRTGPRDDTALPARLRRGAMPRPPQAGLRQSRALKDDRLLSLVSGAPEFLVAAFLGDPRSEEHTSEL